MTSRPVPQLAHVDEEELERLAVIWRARARRGDREAFGIAHTNEVELRRRQRASQMQQLPEEPVPMIPWWKFWKRGPASVDKLDDGRASET
jgi:hypothetical protein